MNSNDEYVIGIMTRPNIWHEAHVTQKELTTALSQWEASCPVIHCGKDLVLWGKDIVAMRSVKLDTIAKPLEKKLTFPGMNQN